MHCIVNSKWVCKDTQRGLKIVDTITNMGANYRNHKCSLVGHLFAEGEVRELIPSPNPSMGLLLDTQNCGLRMRRESWERFPRHRFQRKLLVSDPDMHHGTCVTHVPWCMSGSLNRGGGGKRSRHSRHMRNSQFRYLVRGPWNRRISLGHFIFISF